MKDPKKETEQQNREKMAIVTSFERMIIGDKVRLDTDGLTKLVNCKVR